VGAPTTDGEIERAGRALVEAWRSVRQA